jgi:hypothetical protein
MRRHLAELIRVLALEWGEEECRRGSA